MFPMKPTVREFLFFQNAYIYFIDDEAKRKSVPLRRRALSAVDKIDVTVADQSDASSNATSIVRSASSSLFDRSTLVSANDCRLHMHEIDTSVVNRLSDNDSGNSSSTIASSSSSTGPRRF